MPLTGQVLPVWQAALTGPAALTEPAALRGTMPPREAMLPLERPTPAGAGRLIPAFPGGASQRRPPHRRVPSQAPRSVPVWMPRARATTWSATAQRERAVGSSVAPRRGAVRPGTAAARLTAARPIVAEPAGSGPAVVGPAVTGPGAVAPAVARRVATRAVLPGSVARPGRSGGWAIRHPRCRLRPVSTARSTAERPVPTPVPPSDHSLMSTWRVASPPNGGRHQSPRGAIRRGRNTGSGSGCDRSHHDSRPTGDGTGVSGQGTRQITSPIRCTRIVLVIPATPGGVPATTTTSSPGRQRPIWSSAVST